MKRIFLLISVYFLVFVFLGILWYYPVMPFVFYSTLADAEMKLKMENDLIAFYGIVRDIHNKSNSGTALTTPEKIVLVLTPTGEYGFLLWPILGILIGLLRGLPYRFRMKEQVSVSHTYNL
ncbi:hypothetical protein JT359_13125 [Candidatus Poribacteria bacterium]|nr:hypothetical protein [Candidatus Poribacteria bacterium]